MENNFQQLIAALQISSSYNDSLCEITQALEKQNSELQSSFISQLYQSILTLEHWTWQLLSQNFQQWIKEPNYLQLFRTLAIFNKNLIFNYDNIEADMKASLLIPETIDWINGIFEHLEKINDENNPFISIISLWFDNLSYFLREWPEFESSTIISYINRHIARNYVMTDQYKFYLTELRQSPVPQSIFTAKQLFYIKTCSFSLSSYLFAKPEDFLYTAEEIIRHFSIDYVQIILLHSCTIESWSTNLFTCITYLVVFCSCCCWWGGDVGTQVRAVLSTESIACEYINALIHIISYKPLHQCITTRRSNDQIILLDTILFSMLNIAQHGDFTWFLRSKISLPKTLLTIAETSVCEKISLCVYGIFGEILSDKCLKELKISNSVSAFFFNVMEQAWHHPSKKYKQIPVFNLLKFFVSLSKIDAIQQATADMNKVPLLIEMCDQYPIVFDILWALSFNHDIQQQLRSNTSFMTKLVHLPKQCDNEQMRKITHGILWNLESNHEDRTITEINDEKTFDIMISYSHKDEIICRKIYDELIKAGYRVWIDFDQIHGNVMDAMAQAIERSNTILICMSEQYRRSNYCRAEAYYAFQRQLRILPIILQEHYQPDGWLLFLVGQLLYVNFTIYEFSQAIEILIKELKAPAINEIGKVSVCPKEETDAGIPATPISPKPSKLPIFPENMLDWTSTHVQDWLISHGLLQMSHLFANFDGRSLIYMNQIIENVELQRVVSLLQEDSLRRTNQNLSLIELSYFRSLMNQQKLPLTSAIMTKPTKMNLTKLKRKSFACCRIM